MRNLIFFALGLCAYPHAQKRKIPSASVILTQEGFCHKNQTNIFSHQCVPHAPKHVEKSRALKLNIDVQDEVLATQQFCTMI
jgi:hypothetical protein